MTAGGPARWVLGLREVSGLAARADPASGEPEVLAVGDRTTSIARLRRGGDARVQRVTGLPADLAAGRHGSQWEGVAADGAGRVVVLRERGSELLVLSAALQFERRVRLRHRWRDERRFGLEGLVLLRGGHVLAAKQRHPLRLLEFGPAGDRPLGLTPDALPAPDEPASVPRPDELRCLATWRLVDDTLTSINDIAAHAGSLYLISSAARRIARVRLPAADPVRIERRWPLPAAVTAAPGARAEGLLVDDRWGVLVGVDAHGGGPTLFRVGQPWSAARSTAATERSTSDSVVSALDTEMRM